MTLEQTKPTTVAFEDVYGPVAEFYDLLSEASWAQRVPLLEPVLQEIDDAQGPVLDVGAGTGRAIELASRARPTTRFIAIEPSLGMRVAMCTRLAASPGLAERTTVIAGTLQEAALAAKLGGAIALGVVGHLTPGERGDLWRLLRERLAVGAPALVDVLDQTAPPTRAPLRLARRTVGDLVYESWSSGRGATAGEHRWNITYRVLCGQAVVRSHTMRLRWSAISLQHVADEVSPLGFTLREIGPDLAVLRVSEGDRA